MSGLPCEALSERQRGGIHLFHAQQVQCVDGADCVNDAVHGADFMEVDLIDPHPVRRGFGGRQRGKHGDALLPHRLRKPVRSLDQVTNDLQVAMRAVVVVIIVRMRMRVIVCVLHRVRVLGVAMLVRVGVPVTMPPLLVCMHLATMAVRVRKRVSVGGVLVVVGVVVRVGVSVRVRVTLGLPPLVGVRVGVCVRMRMLVRMALSMAMRVGMLVDILSLFTLMRSATDRHFLVPVDGADLDVGRGNVPLAPHDLVHVQVPLVRQREDAFEPRDELIPWSALWIAWLGSRGWGETLKVPSRNIR